MGECQQIFRGVVNGFSVYMEKHMKPVEPVGIINDSFGILNWIEIEGSCVWQSALVC